MFPSAGSTVYYNEAGEPMGWDAADDGRSAFDPDDFYESYENWIEDEEDDEDLDEPPYPMVEPDHLEHDDQRWAERDDEGRYRPWT